MVEIFVEFQHISSVHVKIILLRYKTTMERRFDDATMFHDVPRCRWWKDDASQWNANAATIYYDGRML